MSIRKFALVASVAATTLTLGLTVSGADAQPAPPPPPTSHNGHPVQLVASGPATPTSFAFGAGKIFVGDGGNSEGSGPPNGGVWVVSGGKASRISTRIKFVAGLAWHDNALYISGGALRPTGVVWQLIKWSGWNGKTFTQRRAIFQASKGFDGWNGIGFGADGRLYAGVDVGLLSGNDHGPAKTPHVYDILSFRSDGKDERVVARGIRQPWQMAFPAHSNSPYVTDLGQDSGAKNPPDFILRVKAGQNYGFPKCNHTSKAACKGYATPFRTFGPHTDLMGIAISGSTLYLTSFAGPKGAGPGGEVYSLNTKSGGLKPLLTGFAAPTVGLGLHGGYVYVGELTGQVFRVKV